MRSTTLFSLYAGMIAALILCLGWLTVFSLDKAHWWDERSRLANESYELHLKLQADIYRLLKQHRDALLFGNQDDGAAQLQLRDRINATLEGIRSTIAREIQMVGQEELEELALIDEIGANVKAVHAALLELYPVSQIVDTGELINQLEALAQENYDLRLASQIEEALEEEKEEVEEVAKASAAFRDTKESITYAILLIAFVLMAVGFVSFNAQFRRPLLRLQESLSRLRRADYTAPVALGGSREFMDLSRVLGDMVTALSQREASRNEMRQQLEATVIARTKELERMVQRLETGESNRKRLMADISHELRTPLAIILGEADVALRTRKDLDGGQIEALTRIRESAKHTNQIVDDMLTVARQEAGQLRLDRREVDLRSVVRDAVDMFPQMVKIDVPSEPVLFAVDEVRLRQSVLAILQNARRYGGPRISVELQTTSSDIKLMVQDDGPGLSDEEKRNAFERFYRGTNASSQEVEGTGLGLPVVKSIVVAHGGDVILSDSKMGGLAVSIHLYRSQLMRVVAGVDARKTA